MKEQNKIKIWQHPDGRSIRINADHKVRYGYSDDIDHWRILWRNNVPNLTDEEWYAAPNSEWEVAQ